MSWGEDLLFRIEARNRNVDAMLQLLKSGGAPFLIERDDLAVENDRRLDFLQPGCDRFDNVRELVGLFVAVARPETNRWRRAR